MSKTACYHRRDWRTPSFHLTAPVLTLRRVAVDAVGNPRSVRVFQGAVGAFWVSTAPTASIACRDLGEVGRSRKLRAAANEVRAWSCNLQTLGDRLDAPTDRASRLSCATV